MKSGLAPRIILALASVFILAPLVLVVIASFKLGGNPWSSQPYTIEAYSRAVSLPVFREAAINSVWIALASSFIALVLGSAAAYGIDRGSFLGRNFLRTVFIAPLSLPRVVSGMALFILYLTAFRPIYDTISGIVIAHVLLLLPFVVSIVGAGLSWVDPKLEEAARDLGDSPAQALLHIVCPLTAPALGAAFGLSFIISFDEVDTTIFLMRSKMRTLPVEVMNYAQNHQDGTVAAISVLILLATLIFALFIALFIYLLVRRSGARAAMAGN